jgi:hypothetical protein
MATRTYQNITQEVITFGPQTRLTLLKGSLQNVLKLVRINQNSYILDLVPEGCSCTPSLQCFPTNKNHKH